MDLHAGAKANVSGMSLIIPNQNSGRRICQFQVPEPSHPIIEEINLDHILWMMAVGLWIMYRRVHEELR